MGGALGGRKGPCFSITPRLSKPACDHAQEGSTNSNKKIPIGFSARFVTMQKKFRAHQSS